MKKIVLNIVFIVGFGIANIGQAEETSLMLITGIYLEEDRGVEVSVDGDASGVCDGPFGFRNPNDDQAKLLYTLALGAMQAKKRVKFFVSRDCVGDGLTEIDWMYIEN